MMPIAATSYWRLLIAGSAPASRTGRGTRALRPMRRAASVIRFDRHAGRLAVLDERGGRRRRAEHDSQLTTRIDLSRDLRRLRRWRAAPAKAGDGGDRDGEERRATERVTLIMTGSRSGSTPDR
jgi:hypothetical protein